MKSSKTFFKKAYIYKITLILIIASIALIAPSGALAAGQAFTDLPESDPAYPFVNYLVKTNQIQGYPDGSFRPAGSITRAEAAALLVRAAKLDIQEPATGQTYTDLDPSHWAYPVVQTAARAGLIQGYPDQTYRPEAPVTRAEACALLLRLTSMPLPEDTTLDQTITDIEPTYWARQQIAVALQAGLITIAQKNSFAPEAQATRAQFARGLATILNIDPERNKTTLTGTLTPIKGKTTIIRSGQSPQEITATTTCEAGTTIKTGPDSRAELNFADGSGLRLDSNTTLTITEARGQTTILKDGTPGTVIDHLKLELTQGRLFGALASTYINKKTPGKTASAKNIQLAYATKDLPPGLIIAEGETDSQDLQWWQEAFEEKVRVEVDMPWGVATVRGTFWMNQVGPGYNITSVVDGHVEVISNNGQSVTVTPGQTTTVTSPDAPPTPPEQMTPEEQQTWEEAGEWVEERATTIEQTAPVVTPPVPVEQQAEQLPGLQPGEQPVQQPENPVQQTIGQNIIDTVNQATNNTDQGNTGTTPATPSSGGGSSNNDDTGPKEQLDIPPGNLTTDLVQTFSGGDVTITIPSGTTLGDGAAVSVQEHKKVTQLPEGTDMAGQAADISVTGAPPGTAITIGLKCAPGKEKVAIYYYNPGTRAWEYQNSTVDTNNWIVTASVQHFSLYAVLEDNTPPAIKNVKPYDKATSVPVDQAITITFSENIVPGENYYDHYLRGGSKNISLSGSIDGKVLTLTPLENLDYNATYTLDLPAGLVQDGIGNPMAEGRTISFTTSDTGANLKSLVLSAGSLSPAFSSGVKNYTAEVEDSVESITLTASAADPEATIKINGIVTASDTQSAPVAIGNEDTTITIEVTGKDGRITKTYTVTVARASKAELSSLSINAGSLSPAFSPSVASYTAEVENSVTSVTVTANTVDPSAKIKINGKATASGEQSAPITMGTGETTITIEVKAKNGKTVKTYTIKVTRLGGADLRSLELSKGSLDPAFSPTTTSYTAIVDRTESSITVTATAADAGATIKVNGTATASGTPSAPVTLGTGETTITIEMTAKDGRTVKIYTVTVTRPGNAELSSLTISAGNLSPTFSPATTSYTAEVGSSVQSVIVTATPADTGATLKINGMVTVGGAQSAPVTIGNEGATITIEVTAKDGRTVKTYTVTVSRAGKAELSSLAISAGSLSPAFNPATTSYSVEVDSSVTSASVIATASDPGATIKINGTTVASGAPATVSLSEGANTITVSVTARGGNAGRIYTITVTRATKPQEESSSSSSQTNNNSAISPATATFDKNISETNTGHYVDVTVTMTLNGNTLASIKNGDVTLSRDTGSGGDYIVSGNTVTIKKQYLATQSVGTTTLTFNFSAGSPVTLSITVSCTPGFGGRVTDVNGAGVSEITITFKDSEGNIVGTTTTDLNGYYHVNLPPGTYTGELSKTGYLTTTFVAVCSLNVYDTNQNAVAITVPVGDETRIVLTWGQYPQDLDSHLVGFTTDEQQLFHIYFANKKYPNNGTDEYAELDIDDTTSYGPETTTIYQYTQGRYRFYVHHFSGMDTLRTSGAEVKVYRGSSTEPTKTYNVPTGSGTEYYWAVFDLVVDANEEVSFVDINMLVVSDYLAQTVGAPNIPTITGNLAINPSNATEYTTQTITLTYTPGEDLTDGTVVFTIPAELIAVQTNDTIDIAGAGATRLTAGQISDGGQTVTITGVTATTAQTVVLTLTGKTVPAANTYFFSVTADADGAGTAKTASAGNGNETKTFTSGMAGTVIQFAEANLKAAVRLALNKPTGDIMAADMLLLTSLDAGNADIQDLTGLQYATNLQVLGLSQNQISDIEALASLTNLQNLYLAANQISDITPLVNNSGLDSGDFIDLRNNLLDLAPGSQDMEAINALVSRGVDVIVQEMPVITGITAADGGNNVGLGNGDTIIITFDVDTNQPAVNDKAAVDVLIDFGVKSFGLNYSGTWTDAKTLVLTVSDATGGTIVTGDMIAVKIGGNLKTADGLSAAGTSSSTIGGSFSPTALVPITNTYIAGGNYHSVVLNSDGTVWAWGNNDCGQLGNGSIIDSSAPVQVQGITGVAAVAAMACNTLALKEDGTIWAWGDNFFGQLGNGTTIDDSSLPVQVQGLYGMLAVSAGDYHIISLKSDGTVWTWGYNFDGQLGNGSTTNSSTPVQVQGLTGVTAVAAGDYHSLALKSDGTVWAWGQNLFGQLGDGSTTNSSIPVQVNGLTGVIAIAAGNSHSIALKGDGSVWTWGNNDNGQLGDGTTTERHTPVQVQDLAGVTAIGAGSSHSLAIKVDQTVWAWGLYSQLGDGTATDSNTPVQAQGLTGVTAVAAGNDQTIALKVDGTVWTWGGNSYGQLGDGTTIDRYNPVQVFPLAPALATPENYSVPVTGSAIGTTKIAALSLPVGATKWQVIVGPGPFIAPVLDSVVAGAVDYTAGADMTASAGQHILLLATDENNHVKGYADITLSAGQIASTISWVWREQHHRLYSVCYGSGMYLAVGDYGAILSSPDGVIWTAQTSGTTNHLYSVTWDGSQYLAVGYNSTILSSPDGVIWTAQTSGTTNHLYSVTWGGSQYLAVGDNGIILSSPDGVIWTAQTSGITNDLYSVTWGGSQYLAVGFDGTILSSPDGVIWTAQTSGTTNRLLSVTWGGSQYLAVGDNGIILSSPDGVIWTAQTSGTTYPLYSVTWGGSQYLVSGYYGILQSGQIPIAQGASVILTPTGSGIGYIATVTLTGYDTATHYQLLNTEDLELTTKVAVGTTPVVLLLNPGDQCKVKIYG